MHTKFWSEALKERDCLEDVGIDERKYKTCLREIVCQRVNWIDVAQDRGRWRAVVNAIMQLRTRWEIY
jgi:hypothetical protein